MQNFIKYENLKNLQVIKFQTQVLYVYSKEMKQKFSLKFFKICLTKFLHSNNYSADKLIPYSKIIQFEWLNIKLRVTF